MERRSNSNHPERCAEGSNRSPVRQAPSSIPAFSSEDTDWHHSIIGFLETHPNSSLLAVVQHLWPGFLNYSTDRRARIWFRVKAQLLALEKIGVLHREYCETDIAVWAIKVQ